MIDEPLQETACLHVLGLLDGDEAAAFERDLARDPDLRELVRSLNDATVPLAQSAPSVAPPGDLRQRLLEALGDRSKPAAIPLAPARDRRWPLAGRMCAGPSRFSSSPASRRSPLPSSPWDSCCRRSR